MGLGLAEKKEFLSIKANPSASERTGRVREGNVPLPGLASSPPTPNEQGARPARRLQGHKKIETKTLRVSREVLMGWRPVGWSPFLRGDL